MPPRMQFAAKNFEYDVARIIPFLTQLPAGASAWDFYRIWVIHNDGAKPENFDVDAAGLTAALAVTDASDVIWMPPCSITLSFTLPAGAGMASMANDAIIVGTVTLGGDNSYMQSMVIAPSVNNSSPVYGVIGPSATDAVAVLNNCLIRVTQAGSGNAYGARQPDAVADLLVFNCDVEATSTGGSGYGGAWSGDGRLYAKGGNMHGSTDVSIEI